MICLQTSVVFGASFAWSRTERKGSQDNKMNEKPMKHQRKSKLNAGGPNRAVLMYFWDGSGAIIDSERRPPATDWLRGSALDLLIGSLQLPINLVK